MSEAKSSKQVANYREGSPSKHCAICTMFRPPHDCTAVAGQIDADAVCDYFKRKVSAVEKASASKLPLVLSLSARSLDIPNDPHPNKMPFSGILTRIDEPSDAAPDGSAGKRVMITMEAAEQALDSLLGMAVDFTPEWDGHDPTQKIGVITASSIKDNAICIEGYIWSADFPEVAKQIKANKEKLGFSFEARNLMTYDRDADPVPICECVFTGAAILLKDKAAYTTTSINARKGVQDNLEICSMNPEMKAQLDAIAASVAELAKSVAAQGETITKLNEEKVQAANHLAKVERHAAELEKAADHMDASGVGGDPDRGHAKILRDMAGDIRAQAVQGRIPAAFYSMRAAAETKVEQKVDVEGAVKAAAEKVTAEMSKKLDELKAQADTNEKALKDQLAVAQTQIDDLKAKNAAQAQQPERKTFSPASMRLLAKAQIGAPEEGKKLAVAQIDKLMSEAGLNPDQRFQLKTDMAKAGWID